MGVYDELKARGLIAQTTNEEKIRDLLNNDKITFYIGFDPTADSLHVGHFVQIMVMSWMQKAGHVPIALFGGGTGMIGDPSGKTDMRKMLTKETIDHNIACFQKQMSRLIDFSEGKAIMANNGDWLLNLNYIDFLREVGVHFSVNRMLAAECYKQRLERGLSFFELNYMLMQSYDFLELNHRHNCVMELGGDDQWSNIIGGVELLRRKEAKEVYGMTFTLLTTSEGKKMGKTEKGALWLDPARTTPFEFYQYWRNVGDQDVERFLSLLTLLPMDEVRRLGALPGEQINEAKRVLAFEVTKMIHGEAEAQKAADAALALFAGGAASQDVPTWEVNAAMLAEDNRLTTLLASCGLCTSRGDARKMVQQGAVLVADQKVTDVDYRIDASQIGPDGLMLRKGKKNYCRLILK